MKKWMKSIGVLSAIAAPAVAVVSCVPQEPEIKLETGEIGLAMVDQAHVDKIVGKSGSNGANLTIEASKKLWTEFQKKFTKNELGDLKGITMSVVPNFTTIADEVIAGKLEGGFVSSNLMHVKKDELKVAFLASRPGINYADGKVDDGTQNEEEVKKGLIAQFNKYYKGIVDATGSADAPKHDKLYNNAQPVDFYRGFIYTTSEKAKKAWGSKDLDAFMKCGVITHGSGSVSGYIEPEKMIQEHFKEPTFKFTDAKWSAYMKIRGSKSDLHDAKYNTYFSFGGEFVQNLKPAEVLEDQKKFKENGAYHGLQVIAVSRRIPNDGFVMRNQTSPELVEKMMKAFQALLASGDPLLHKAYYHSGYKKPSKETLKLIYNS